MERDELCRSVLLSQYTTGTLSLREKRSGYIGAHMPYGYAHQVPAFFKCLLMHMLSQYHSVSIIMLSQVCDSYIQTNGKVIKMPFVS